MSEESVSPGVNLARERAEDMVRRADEVSESDIGGRGFRTPTFMRMRFTQSPEEQMIVQRAHAEVNRRIGQRFSDAIMILNQVYDIVRSPQVDNNGEPIKDGAGRIVWARIPGTNEYDEDFTRLTRRQIEHFIGAITVRFFVWQQAASELWLEATLARGRYEDRFATVYDDAPAIERVNDKERAVPVEGRTNRATRESAEERYYAIFATAVSRQADGVVRSMESLGQRLKDVLTA